MKLRRRWPLWALAAYAALVGVILLAPGSPSDAVDTITAWLRDGLGLSLLRQGWVEFAGNIALFLPLGFLLSVVWRRPWVGVVVAVVVSIAAEVVQLALPARTASLRDVVANVAGAVIGATVAWLLLRRRRERPASTQRFD